MTTKLKPKKSYRRYVRRARRPVRRKRSYRRRTSLLEQLLHERGRRRYVPPTGLILRLVNILGLVLIVLVIAVIGGEENLQEIMNLGKELFLLLH